MRCLCCQCVATCLRYPQRFLMQFGRVKPHGACHRLAVGKARPRRHQSITMLGRHLNKIAKHRIVPDFQRRYTRGIAITRLQLRNGLPPVATRNTQHVQRSIIALGDIAALRGICRR